jgi:hypothetical protein
MNRRLIVRPEAEADITNGAVWYESRESGLGLELISDVHSAIARALKNPDSLRVFGEILRFVVFSLDGFPFASSSLSGST